LHRNERGNHSVVHTTGSVQRASSQNIYFARSVAPIASQTTMSTNGPPHPLRLYLLSHPRTVSSLFCKLFSEHPNINQQLYAFLFTHFLGPESQTQTKNEIMDELNESHRPIFAKSTYQAELDKLERQIAETEAAVCLSSRNFIGLYAQCM
jgi:hypothetical protein